MGFSLGLIITINYAPLFAAIGAGIGIIAGSIISHFKSNF